MKITQKLTRTVARTKLRVSHNSPHILFGVGIAGVVTATVMACRATLKSEALLDDIQHEIDLVKEDKEGAVDGAKDVAYVYAKSAVRLGRAYAPAMGVGVVSIGLLTGSHIQLTRRNTAMTLAYAGLHKAFMEYRERVRAEVGEDGELDLYFGATDETIKGDNGKPEFRKVVDPSKLSPYAKFFDEGSPNWQKHAEYNRVFVQCQQNYANQILLSRGHLFLNEVYDMLGINRTSAGQAVGWVINDEGDNFVDFGLFEARNSGLVNGEERSILLDFNVDGVIINKI